MGTHANVITKTQEGKIRAIYVHYDGYLDFTGIILLNEYNSQELVDNLIAIGDISSLCDTIEDIIDNRYNYGVEYKEYDSLEHYFNKLSSTIEYVYYYDNGEWFVNFGNKSKEFKKLSEQL